MRGFSSGTSVVAAASAAARTAAALPGIAAGVAAMVVADVVGSLGHDRLDSRPGDGGVGRRRRRGGRGGSGRRRVGRLLDRDRRDVGYPLARLPRRHRADQRRTGAHDDGRPNEGKGKSDRPAHPHIVSRAGRGP